MSNIDKQALRERYSPQPAPECHICGKEMTIQRMSARRITYGCTGATYDDKGCHYAEGRSIADDHYEQSRVTVVDVSDPDVLALLDELEHYKSREERVTKLVLDNSTSWDALYKKLEAAEKRIAELDKRLIEYAGIATREAHRVAELEARTVILPEPIIVLHRRDFTDAHREIYAYPEAEVNAALADAGIGVNGE
ncbi:ead/Ea22-like family protein [Salmonella enterica subsp. enterica serovar Bredeney]|nr:ead/Ea22-like family protein [Salmonella enterica subsp. enterica serovar Schwarzengrund]EDB1819945.1 ead/Ea22-like family protein [Salmonella enterica subsp. enterica serovar Bredeney]EDS3921305.1 ead/Ea22-like family protein [Salmonella enterica subsp. enterica serovar Bredeney]EKN5257979.1 ead/Ea22-like family protein [Salmonella enterica]